jgi:hypothetical protein
MQQGSDTERHIVVEKETLKEEETMTSELEKLQKQVDKKLVTAG